MVFSSPNTSSPDTVTEYVMALSSARYPVCDCGGICFCSSYSCVSDKNKQSDVEAMDAQRSHDLEMAMYSMLG